jgi:hypothetical protein
MIDRIALLLGVMAAVIWSEPVAAQLLPRTPPPLIFKNPMVFYVARGAPDACGPDCREWIAAEGDLDRFSLGRLMALLDRLNGRKLPIFFHSPGGSLPHGLAMGRLIRERGLTTGVSQSVPQECATVRDDTCKLLKTSGLTLNAELHGVARCSSACVMALIGGRERLVPPGAEIGVHLPGVFRRRPDGSRVAEAEVNRASANKIFDDSVAKIQKHIRDMEIEGGLFHAIERTPYESISRLSRDEIAAFGIDPRPLIESRWAFVQIPGSNSFIGKFMTERRAKQGTYRSRMVRLSCGGPRRVALAYGREALEAARDAVPNAVFVIGGAYLNVSQQPAAIMNNPFQAGANFHFNSENTPTEMLEESARDKTITLFESDPGMPMAPPWTSKLSTEGLADALKKMKAWCAAPN